MTIFLYLNNSFLHVLDSEENKTQYTKFHIGIAKGF